MAYVDGFLLPIKTKDLKAYEKISAKAGKVWREHGALDYKECVGDDLKPKGFPPFKNAAGARTGETVVFSYIVFKSRKHRDTVNAKVMKDPRIAGMCDPKKLPFDPKRMFYGGFKVLVDE